jgi:hypothetical protein
MKGRAGILIVLSAALMFALVSCGGGGGAAAISLIPKGDYFSIGGTNPAQKYNSAMFKEYADEVKTAEDAMEDDEDKADDMGIELAQYNAVINFSSTDANENIAFHGGPFKEDDLSDYCEDELNWEDMEEEEEEGRKYFVGENDRGFILASGGALMGHKDAIEDIIDVMAKGDKKLIDDKDYKEAVSLVDFNATEFSLVWDNMNQQLPGIQNMVRQITQDDDIIDAIGEIEAMGQCAYWGNTLRMVMKLRFDKDKDAETVEEFLNDDMDEIFEKLGPPMLRAFFRGEDLQNEDDIEDLAEKTVVTRSGNLLEIRFEVSWEDLKDFLD